MATPRSLRGIIWLKQKSTKQHIFGKLTNKNHSNQAYLKLSIRNLDLDKDNQAFENTNLDFVFYFSNEERETEDLRKMFGAPLLK